MTFKQLKLTDLVQRYETLKALHTGSSGRTFSIGSTGDYAVYIEDKRLNDLLFALMMEARDEIAHRFPPNPALEEKYDAAA